jgi:hypothetical protein
MSLRIAACMTAVRQSEQHTLPFWFHYPPSLGFALISLPVSIGISATMGLIPSRGSPHGHMTGHRCLKWREKVCLTLANLSLVPSACCQAALPVVSRVALPPLPCSPLHRSPSVFQMLDKRDAGNVLCSAVGVASSFQTVSIKVLSFEWASPITFLRYDQLFMERVMYV